MTAAQIDLSSIAQHLADAQERASALPYKVEFSIDAERQLLIARASYKTGGLTVNSATTGRRLAEVFDDPREAFDYMLGFLEACRSGSGE